MNDQGNAGPGPGPRDLLDAYFDGELDRAGKARLHEALRHDPLLADEFSRTSEALSMLRQSAANTALEVDLTGRVLASYETRRGFLSRRGRRFVLAGRTSVALAALAMTAGVVAWVRLTPPELRLPDTQRPLGILIDRGAAEAPTMGVVPQRVQQELADSIDPGVDPGKVERTIVFNLQPDGPGTFSIFREGTDRTDAVRGRASLPLLASVTPRGHDTAAGAHAPLRQDGMAAASVVPHAIGSAGHAQSDNWWSRSNPNANHRAGLLLFGLGGETRLPTIPDAAESQRERE